jgi:hypothetical protein
LKNTNVPTWSDFEPFTKTYQLIKNIFLATGQAKAFREFIRCYR